MSEEQLIHRSFAALVDQDENQDVFGESGERLGGETDEDGFLDEDEEWNQDGDGDVDDVDEDDGEDPLEEEDEE